MPDETDMRDWAKRVRRRYESYLETSFFFSDPALRASFRNALRQEEKESVLKGPYPEPYRRPDSGAAARELAAHCFPGQEADLIPALDERNLYWHQEEAVRAAFEKKRNVFVATGTASGKTESFLYPILFELYRQHLAGELQKPGVRALILYPMNALANDQRERLGQICESLQNADSSFAPTFGQYIGQTPEDEKDRWRNAAQRLENRLPGERVLRKEMRATPPHILLTNYSMLEYLLIRPNDSPLFDAGKHWQFMVLDEAHQYRGAKGMEMGMLIRRLKQRLRDGGRREPFQCIATSATISSGASETEKATVAAFAHELFAEDFSSSDIIFGEFQPRTNNRSQSPRRYHAFLRALEGAFLVHKDGKDEVVLNRKQEKGDGAPLEIALCRECGQHYYVGREQGGKLTEAVRDPSDHDFGVEYYLPISNADASSKSKLEYLCRNCGAISSSKSGCGCAQKAPVPVQQCESHKEHADQLKECAVCGYRRGGIGDPVQEIVHGSDGPNSVIATALHELLPPEKRRILSFADSRQEAAFFAWYAQDSHDKLRDRNLMWQAVMSDNVAAEGLSIKDMRNRLFRQWDKAGLLEEQDTAETGGTEVMKAILREAVTDERRLSLSGVGLVKWFVKLPKGLRLPDILRQEPWNFTEAESRALLDWLLDNMRSRRALHLPESGDTPPWEDISPYPQTAFRNAKPNGSSNVSQWGGAQSSVVRHFLASTLKDGRLSDEAKQNAFTKLMREIFNALRRCADAQLLEWGTGNEFRLNSDWLRLQPASDSNIWECKTCATISGHNIRGICPRNRCPGRLTSVNSERLANNHYRRIYECSEFPGKLRSEEHTAQIDADHARERQEEFKEGKIHLLSSSTTFEVGVDLGDLDVVFLRNVPPEPFNYTQRAGRAGRREGTPGRVLTYCRRNPHDLYHYQDPEESILNGEIRPPRLRMTNEKIILRHMVAVTLSAFFKRNESRFQNVELFVGDWKAPRATGDVRAFCARNEALRDSLRHIVPEDMHEKLGLGGDSWIEKITDANSRLGLAQQEVCADYNAMEDILAQYRDQRGKGRQIDRIEKRQDTIAKEKTLNFLSRKAVIPKYGFPVDVVELDTHPRRRGPTGVTLQRDLSQAIAEYAPGGKVVADKKEWKSCGVKKVHGKEWPVRYYARDRERNSWNFEQWHENPPQEPPAPLKKYLIPEFGFVTPIFGEPKEPKRRAQRLYTTRPFFPKSNTRHETQTLFGVKATKAVPGKLVVLCEGKDEKQFYICRECGAHMTGRSRSHKTPAETPCLGTLERFSLGHELETDVMRLQFPDMHHEWDAYSVAFAVLLGAADELQIPDNDLNVTLTSGEPTHLTAIVLYDNVPGGAGLVEQLEEAQVFESVLRRAKQRVTGACGCDSSCYGCLRSYRNQFAHPHLDRTRALAILETALRQ